MIKREIEICGKKIPFRSSATIPRLSRAKFKRDIFKDLSKLEKSYVGTQKDGAEFQILMIWKFLKMWRISWHTMPITVYPSHDEKNGSTSSICFLFMRRCHKFWNYGEIMWI